MPDDKFEKLMEDWAEGEVNAAPQLKPTEKMFRLVASRSVRKSFLLSKPGFTTVSIGIAAVFLLLIGYLILTQTGPFTLLSGELVVAQLPERGLESVDYPIVTLVSGEIPKGRGKGAQNLPQVSIQVLRSDADTIESLEFGSERFEPLTLSNEDNYRIVFHPRENRYFYVFLLGQDQQIFALHPTENWPDSDTGESVYLPSSPNWYFLSGSFNEIQLLIFCSQKPMTSLVNAYSRYDQASESDIIELTRDELHNLLLILGQSQSDEIQSWDINISLE